MIQKKSVIILSIRPDVSTAAYLDGKLLYTTPTCLLIQKQGWPFVITVGDKAFQLQEKKPADFDVCWPLKDDALREELAASLIKELARGVKKQAGVKVDLWVILSCSLSQRNLREAKGALKGIGFSTSHFSIISVGEKLPDCTEQAIAFLKQHEKHISRILSILSAGILPFESQKVKMERRRIIVDNYLKENSL